MTTIVEDMVMIHRVFRREFAALPESIRDVASGDVARAKVLTDHAGMLLDVLHHHHEAEDVLLWPRLRERAVESTELLDAMESEHHSLAALIAQVRSDLASWSGAATSGNRLADVITTLAGSMTEHLDHEEETMLPVCTEHVTQPEWNQLGERALGSLPFETAMIVLAAMREDATEEEWAEFIPLLPEPVQDAYHQHAETIYRAYITTIRDRPEATQPDG